MTNYNDGKIHGWNGGECPVHPKTVVEVWLRLASVPVGSESGCFWDWRHENVDRDIIAFRVVREHREPKTIWVNEYDDGIHTAFSIEEKAESRARVVREGLVRIAVKYQEVIE